MVKINTVIQYRLIAIFRAMKSLLASGKVVGVVLATVFLYLIYLAGYGLLRIFRKPAHNWLNYILKFWGKTTAKFLSITVRVEGKRPRPPFFLVSNHLSYVDIIVLLKTLDTTIVSKSEVKDWPVVGLIARSIGIVFIDRKNKMDIHRVNKEISSKVSAHRGLALFPEGTTSPGASVLRFRPSLLEFPAQSNLGVHYCSIHYELPDSRNSAHETVCWWGGNSMHSHLFELAKESSILATIRFGDKVIVESDRKILAAALHKKVSGIFKPMCRLEDTTYETVKF